MKVEVQSYNKQNKIYSTLDGEKKEKKQEGRIGVMKFMGGGAENYIYLQIMRCSM